MRQQRTIYFNDARHYYLFAFEPPMTLEDAWVPIDEVAGTGVDTFAYGVERGDGLFYPSRVGMMFGTDIQPFEQAAYWRTWHNMQGLIERGLDPLMVLIDRAHDKNMDFWASLRMAGYGKMDPAHNLANGGGGLAHVEVRAHIMEVVRELAVEYETDGIELDFALPGGMPNILRKEDVEATTPVLTDYVEELAELVRRQQGGVVGARVLPTEAMNLAQGLDVRTWLERGLVDFLVPMRYGYMILDGDMPIDWMIEAAHEADVSVYGTLQPYVRDESTGAEQCIWPDLAQLRAASANLLDRGCDGLYAWFMRWPLGDQQRNSLSELGDRDLMREKDKHYVLARSAQDMENQYPVALPIEINADDRQKHAIVFYCADDAQEGRVSQVLLKIKIVDLVSEDRLEVALNGKSLVSEVCRREYGWIVAPYQSMWLVFDLQKVRPRQGENLLEISLVGRPEDLASPLKVAEVEVLVKYHPLPSGLA
ncbi:MAG TPA: hypothetical protein EYG11_19175 [Candidatus Latescibacteria bacterium]|nr:hypothetical protein [Candidatus Handelsmanbacteria bacterium]HIL10823.1 hypothetical protein [Candidatus Latescibacterota bacterium]